MENVVIVGGGISGLYVAYELLKKSERSRHIVIIEKAQRLGGRVATFHDSAMTVEMGAGRYSVSHRLFIRLLKELGLYERSVPNHVCKGHYHIDSVSSSFIPQSRVDALTKRVIRASKGVSADHLRGMLFLTFVQSVLSKEEADFFVGAFGYYSELVLMNAYDCLHLIRGFSAKYYSLRGGLSLVIEALEKRIRSLGGIFRLGVEVSAIRSLERGFEIISSRKPIRCDSVVCALTSEALAKIFREGVIYNLLRDCLSTAPFCRIYAKYRIEVGAGNVWFAGLGKITVNNELRMVIPISESEGTIMISYTDNKFAEFWEGVYRSGGEAGLNRVIKEKIREALGITIPDAEEIRAFYWVAGVGYWGVGVDSDSIERRLLRPFDSERLFICGENFSARNQQWMEGALETGLKVVSLLGCSNIYKCDDI